MKKRILLVNESSTAILSGFGRIGLELLTRLYDTNKYEIAEIATYSVSADPKHFAVPWKVYGGVPDKENELATQIYQSDITGQFGSAVFQQVCLDFKPDIVISFMDEWMINFIAEDPFRPYFKWIISPMVDSEPAHPRWIDTYKNADIFIACSQYAKKIIERDSGGQIKVSDVAIPGVNHEIFRSLDREKLRDKFGIKQHTNLITTVMRNQGRKLFPDLLRAFKLYFDRCVENNNEKLARNTYFHFHTSLVDVGFNISRFLIETGLGHKVLFTYVCRACGQFWLDFHATETCYCKFCGRLAACTPNTAIGISQEQLAEIYNISDLYVQYSSSEGVAMPPCEAKSCGIPIIVVDYAAMSEQANIINCNKVSVERFFDEPIMQTEQVRALPNNHELAELLYNFFSNSENKNHREKYADTLREDIIRNYSFDQCAEKYQKIIDALEVPPHEETWLNPQANLLPLDENPPQQLSNSEYIDWCICNILKKPQLTKSHWRHDLLKGLNINFLPDKGGQRSMNREILLNEIKQKAAKHNFWELQRIGLLQKEDPDKIKWSLI